MTMIRIYCMLIKINHRLQLISESKWKIKKSFHVRASFLLLAPHVLRPFPGISLRLCPWKIGSGCELKQNNRTSPSHSWKYTYMKTLLLVFYTCTSMLVLCTTSHMVIIEMKLSWFISRHLVTHYKKCLFYWCKATLSSLQEGIVARDLCRGKVRLL